MRVAIAGAGAVGRSIAQALVSNGHRALLIERERGNYQPDLVPDADWMLGDGCELAALQRAGIETCDVVAATTGDDKANLVFALLAGLCLDFLHISAIQALLYTAILYGLTAPVMIVLVMHICNNPKIMGAAVNKRGSNILGGLALVLMTLSAVALIWFQFS